MARLRVGAGRAVARDVVYMLKWSEDCLSKRSMVQCVPCDREVWGAEMLSVRVTDLQGLRGGCGPKGQWVFGQFVMGSGQSISLQLRDAMDGRMWLCTLHRLDKLASANLFSLAGTAG